MNNTIHPQPSSAARLTWLALLVGFFFSVTAMQAQTATGILAGRVRDGSGNPLAGARVTVADTNLSAVTERDGEYYLGTVPAGSYTVRVTYLGLPSRDELIVVTAGERPSLDVRVGATDSDEVVQLEAMSIEGQRAGQARALNLQRASENLKEIVAADAIGRFPDQNTAEAMQRLSGVALERDQGEGRFISIRGMTASLNSTQIDGVNVPSSERNTRKVNLDTIPSELLDSIELTKALTPDMDGDAIGGSVNLKTKTAFSQEGRILNVSAEGQYTKYADQWGHKYAVTAGSKFGNDRWGILVTLSDQLRYITSMSNEQAGWAQKNGFWVPADDIDVREYQMKRIRKGASMSLDFRPTADDEIYFRGSLSHFSNPETRTRNRFRATTASATPTSDNLGSVAGRVATVEVRDRTEDTNIRTLVLGGEHRRGSMTIDWLAARTYADLDDPFRFETVFQSANTSFNYDFTDQGKPVVTGAALALPPSAFIFNSARHRTSLHTDEETTLALNLKREVGFGANPGYWKAGLKYRAREKNADTDDNRYTRHASSTYTLADVYRPSTFNPGFVPHHTTNAQAAIAFLRNNPSFFVRNAITSSIGDREEDYTTNEDVFAAYLMGSVTLGDFTLLGGARVEQTSFNTKGWEIRGTVNPVFTRTSASRDYTDVLPSLHGIYRFNPKLQGRASVTKSLARPNFPDSAFRSVVNESGDVSQGNPNIKPYSADNFDVSLEYYPGKSIGVLSAGFFAKRIDGFIFQQTLAGAAPGGRNLTIPLNGKTATVSGFEFTYQQQFTQLPAPFDGFGIFLNGTFIDSEMDLGAARPGELLPLMGQSKRVYNAALSYEKHGFMLRVALNQRSAYLDSIAGTRNMDVYVGEHVQIDITTNYKINRQWTVFAEFQNIDGRPRHTYFDVSFRNAQTEFYKWGANAGVKFNF